MGGPTPTKSHQQCLALVCAVCTNLNGKKAQRMLNKTEVLLVRKYVFAGYQEHSVWFPTGICNTCSTSLYLLEKQKGQADGGEYAKGKKVNLRLPEDYICELPIQTRKTASSPCVCRWCKLARLNGLEFKRWQQELKKKPQSPVALICGSCGKGVLVTASSHKCSARDKERIQTLVKSIPEEVKGKLTVALLKEQQGDAGPSTSTLTLPQPQGGWDMKVTIGKPPTNTMIEPMTVKEAQVMASKAHLTSGQQESILADLRSKFGKKIVQPGLQKAVPANNNKYAEFFTVEEKPFLDKEGKIVPNHLYFCHSIIEFLATVDRERGWEGEEQEFLIQGDTG